jgi:hypothetical protein
MRHEQRPGSVFPNLLITSVSKTYPNSSLRTSFRFVNVVPKFLYFKYSLMLYCTNCDFCANFGFAYAHTYFHVFRGCALLIYGFSIGWLDLLTAYTLNSELQAVTALSLIYALYSSLLQALMSTSAWRGVSLIKHRDSVTFLTFELSIIGRDPYIRF